MVTTRDAPRAPWHGRAALCKAVACLLLGAALPLHAEAGRGTPGASATPVALVSQLAESTQREQELRRAQAAELGSRRIALLLGTALATLVLGGGALMSQFRLRTYRAAFDVLSRLARNGWEITHGLDRQAIVHTLQQQLADLTAVRATAVWLRPVGNGAAGLGPGGAPSRPVEDAWWRGEQEDGVSAAFGLAIGSVSFDDIVSGVATVALTAHESARSLPMPEGLAGRVRTRSRAARGADLLVFEPLRVGERVVGVVGLALPGLRRYRRREREIVKTTCQYAAVALANVEAAERLSETHVDIEQRKTQDMLVHTARLVAVGGMVSGIIHEMAHPVGSMMLQSDNAQAFLSNGEIECAVEALNGMHRETRRLQNLVSRLRNLVRADPPQATDVDLATLLADARSLFMPRLRLEGVAYAERLVSCSVRVDVERLSLALSNLVVNAVDAMQGSAVRRLELSTSVTAASAQITVRDTGPGLDPEQRAHLFEPFFTTKPLGRGLGLGLALSAKSVASFKGFIEGGNHPEGGAVFTIHVPLSAERDTADVTDGADDRPTRPASVAASPPGSGARRAWSGRLLRRVET